MHDIFGDRFLGNRAPAWHGLGQTFTDAISASEAIERAGMDYKVIKQEHEVWYTAPDGTRYLVNTMYDLIRLPTEDAPAPVHYGVVTDDYQVMDNIDLGFMLDPLSKIWPVETCGALGDGRQMFITFKTGKYSIGGDEMDGYLLLSEGKDGKKGAAFHQTDVRVVCQNTLRLATKKAQMTVDMPHVEGLRQAVQFWGETLPALQSAQLETRANLQRLAEYKVTAPEADMIVAAAYPLPARKGKALLHGTPEFMQLPEGHRGSIEKAAASVDYYTARQGGFREAAMELYDVFCQEHPNTAGTAWAVANAVVETEDYRRGAGDDRGSAVFGERANAKKRAFSEAFRVAGVKA